MTRMLAVVELPGTRGMRYSAGEVAAALGVSRATVIGWIRAGYLTASLDRFGRYRIRQRSVRRALRDYPQVTVRVVLAQAARDAA